jgi:predicted ribosomally synthesized peptide with SipW-like signal peptide
MRTSYAVKAILALGTLSGALWAGTFATFTDTQDAVSTFTTGTVDLRLNGDATTSYAWTAINLSTMKPGDVIYQPLTVSNNGSLSYSYVMGSSATNTDTKGLRDQLTLGMKLVANAGTCDSAGVGYAASGTTVVAEGALSTRAITARTLAAGATEVLCTYVTLPIGTLNPFQGATTTDTMTFTATQS